MSNDPVQDAIDGLEKVPPIETNEIRVFCSGGVVHQADGVPNGWKVTLIDEDVDCLDGDEIENNCRKNDAGEMVIFRQI